MTVRVGADNLQQYPLNYGANEGTWFVYDPSNGVGGDGAFFPNGKLMMRDFIDGMSSTIAFSEVKAFQAILKTGGTPQAQFHLIRRRLPPLGVTTLRPTMVIRSGLRDASIRMDLPRHSRQTRKFHM